MSRETFSLVFLLLVTHCFSKDPHTNLNKFLSLSDIPEIDIPDIVNELTNGTNPEESNDTSPSKEYINVKCLWVDRSDVYSLQQLQRKEGDYNKTEKNVTIIFNFCQNTNQKIGEVESNSTMLLQNPDGNLVKLTGSIDGDGKNKNQWDHFKDLNEEGGQGISITYVNGEQCNEVQKHLTILKLYCDPNIKDEDFLKSVDLSQFYQGPCVHLITARSIYGCPLTSNYLLNRALTEYKVFFILVFILIGLFFAYFGEKFMTVTIILVTGVIFCFLITVFVLNFLAFLITTEKALLYLIGASFLIGGFVGFLLRAKVTIYVILLGGSLGYSFAIFIYQIIQNFVEWNPEYLYYGTVVICVVFGAIIGLIALKLIFIASTAVLGGYIIMRAFAIWFENYVDEREVIDLIKNKEYEQLEKVRTPWSYAYLALWVFFIVSGSCYQCRGHKSKSD